MKQLVGVRSRPHAWAAGARKAVAALAGIALVAAGALVAHPAHASGPARTVYTAPDGAGSSCSASSPCSIGSAKKKARQFAKSGRDIKVIVADGTYRLSSPLRFENTDGGQRGGSVSWQAAPGAAPILTGATAVTGWSVADEANGIYVADVDSSFKTRQLYVDGVLAQRAQQIVPASAFTVTPTGLTINDAALATQLNALDERGVEFTAIATFTKRFAPVASVSGTTVTMQQPAWDNNTYGYDVLQAPFGRFQYTFENSLAFLDEPGEWFLDSKKERLYVKPIDGADITRSKIEIPRLESILQISGTLAKPVTNLSFTGLTFSGTSWLGPNSKSGYASQQTGAYIDGVQEARPADAFTSCAYGCAGFEATRGEWNQMPAAVQVSAAHDVSFTRNTFRELGSVALGIGNDGGAHASGVNLGAQGIKVTGNLFTQNAGGGAVIGGTRKDAHHPSVRAMTNKDIEVTNNVVTDSALVYEDTSAIFASYVDGLRIANNEISHMPYTAIGVGYGWGIWDKGGSPDYQKRGTYDAYPVYSTPTTARNYVVERNHITDVMERLSDGACIYTLSALPGTKIDRNFCENANDEYGIYNDEASRYITETDNVMVDVRAFFHVNGQNGNLVNDITNTRTYSTTTNANYPKDRNIVVTDPIVLTGGLTSAATAIAYEAGVQEPYKRSQVADRSPVGIDLSASTRDPAPGESFEVIATFTNVDSSQTLDLSDAALAAPAGWEVAPTQAHPQSLLPGANGSATWDVTVPRGLTSPAAATLTLTSTSKMGEKTFAETRVLAVTPRVPTGPPVGGTLSTFTNSGATFAQQDGTYTITGAGTDMFSGWGTVADEYGTIFKPASVGPHSVMTVRVASFDAKANNSKASLVLRNDLTQPGKATGYVSLAVQKDGGVTFFSDLDGDGYLENYTPASGSPTSGPVYLRLVRADDTVTAYWSTDAATWAQVGVTVTVASPEVLLDGGVAYVSAVPDTPGTAVFDRLTITNADPAPAASSSVPAGGEKESTVAG